MKKIFTFCAISALVILAASCNKNNTPEVPQPKDEISFNSAALTKGYVTAATLYDTAIAELHATTPTTTPRQLWMSAYLTPQAGNPGNYFVNEPFAINANGETDGLWHHAPKIYWPLNGTLDFLGYSAGTQLTGTKCVWNETNAATQLILSVSEDQSQDDILYAAVAADSDPTASVAMTFKHTQAWIEFELNASEAGLIEIMDIKLEDIYQKGELTINGGATPSHAWNFASYRASDVVVDDNYSVYGVGDMANPIDTEPKFLDMLIPAQPQTSILITYRLAGQDNVLQYRYTFATATWESAKKYVYKITFTPLEITVTPSVTPFDTPTISGFPDTLS